MDPEHRDPSSAGDGSRGPSAIGQIGVRMIALLRRPPDDALVVGPAGAERDATVASLLETGCVPSVEERLSPVATGRFHAVFLLTDQTPSRSDLEGVRKLLEQKGRLLLALVAPPATAGPGGMRSPGPFPGVENELMISLSEAGFAVRATDHAVPERPLVHAFKDDYRIRSYRPGDEDQILSLFRECFSVQRSREHWRWIYERNPYGQRTISEAFGPDGRLACHYAGYPVRFWLDGGPGPRRLPALQIGDTMTAPQARGIGRGATSLLARTVRHFYAQWTIGRVSFNYGFNTSNIQKFSLRYVGARRIEAVPQRVLEPRKARRILGPLGKLSALLRGYRSERILPCKHNPATVEVFDRSFDELYSRVRSSYGFLLERDAGYLSWRYAAAPDIQYFAYAVYRGAGRGRRDRLIGWSVFKHVDRGERLIWGDALFDQDETWAPAFLLDRVLRQPEHADVRRVEGWLPDRPAWWASRVHELGFRRSEDPDDLHLMVVPFDHPSDSGLELEAQIRERLYYTRSDGDLF